MHLSEHHYLTSMLRQNSAQGSHYGHNASEETEAKEGALALLQDRRPKETAPKEDLQ